MTEIRLVQGDELLTSALPLSAYAFYASPRPTDMEHWQRLVKDREAWRIHVAFDAGQPLATASVIPMTQNVRGALLPMGGVAHVATHPTARRKGYARTLLLRVLEDMYEQGQVVSALYPFRPSFYQRFGYAGLPKPAQARFNPRQLARWIRQPDQAFDDVTLSSLADGFKDFWTLLTVLQRDQHGMALRDPAATGSLLERERWLALAHRDGTVVGALPYEITHFGGQLVADGLFSIDLRARESLLRWLAHHTDQVTEVALQVPADARPELWHIDLDVTVERVISTPLQNAPMVRVLRPEGLNGLVVGAGSVDVAIQDETLPAAGGRFRLSSQDGRLEVTRGGEGTVALTPSGFAALVYGVLDPEEVVHHGWGVFDAEAQQALRTLFPPATPHLFESF